MVQTRSQRKAQKPKPKPQATGVVKVKSYTVKAHQRKKPKSRK